jgi:hypothetical protein
VVFRVSCRFPFFFLSIDCTRVGRTVEVLTFGSNLTEDVSGFACVAVLLPDLDNPWRVRHQARSAPDDAAAELDARPHHYS